MATITETNELDVLGKYESLIAESLGVNSVYIRTKETLQELLKDNNLKATDKASILSSVLVSLNNSLVSSSMATALQWATTEKDVALRKLELEKQLDILDAEILIKETQASTAVFEDVAVQANTIRNFGKPVVVNGVVVSLPDEGKVFNEIALLKEQTLNTAKQGTILDTQEKEAEANVHKIVADTYTNYGKFTYLVDDTGLVSISDSTPVGHTPLSEAQLSIAEEQAKGYAYNAWANAINGASSFLGTAVAGEAAIFGTGQPGEAILADLEVAIDNLKSVQAPTFT